ncbi:CPBP family glutamic-type intramembrane protease [Aliterella atlantica]|uniref:Abortive phage infection protein n=1 Tax=Aliterella atlantica CENA595 TaxID=1618023 RepID=A0A0D8ZVK2_9CYAN|nr:CPBP family glutamic-type intramembrane protease [Aliterella atlantica]KJH72798.1 abortive phage infection protein [Aliterella atlantica CENA595]
MTIKRVILSLLTLVVIFFTGTSLWASWQQPQINSRLELSQTNLLLRAGQLQGDKNDANLTKASKTLVGEEPLAAATKQYQEARESAQKNLAKAKNQLSLLAQQPSTTPAPPKPQEQIAPITNNSRRGQQKQLQKSLNQIEKLIGELDLRLGILQAQQQKPEVALTTWQNTVENSPPSSLTDTANVLIGLWSNPPKVFPDAERLIQANLDGWFQGRAFAQLYQIQQRPDALQTLQAAEQEQAQEALFKLAIISTIPAIAGLTGLALLIYLIFGRLTKGKEALISQNGELRWSTPWDWETVWQVFIVGFFLMGQFVVPLLFALIPKPEVTTARVQALSTLATYLFLAAGAVTVLYFSIRQFLPLPTGWFRFKLRGSWFLWGIGGYCAALPLVVIVSLINQRIWQGQGGSNPLLSLVLEGQDRIALAIFFFTAAIAAPLFEEFLFRGFLLPSLTRYFSVWQAILLSSLLFAVAHLSLSEILPLAVLGVVLGVVYTRSRNLLAPMLLHSLWNSGTLISLFILGSSST